jgi:hypothetical protein
MTEDQIIKIFILSAGGKFETDVHQDTKLSEVARVFFTSRGYPIEPYITIELLDHRNPNRRKRLDSSLNLREAAIGSRDTLYIAPESAGSGWAEILAAAASIGTIALVILMIAEIWSKKQKKQISGKTNQNAIQQNISRDWDYITQIYAEMVDGSRVSFGSWQNDPERIKSFVRIFISSSAPAKILWIVFVFKDRTAIRVDVSDEAVNKQQLEQLIDLLNL